MLEDMGEGLADLKLDLLVQGDAVLKSMEPRMMRQ
jgi:hypothetical protein